MGESPLEIVIHGRGGQGAQVGAQVLAAAFFRSGREVQAFAAYGGERRGAPVTASVRVAAEPIHLRCDVERPAYVIVLDASLYETSAKTWRDATLFVNRATAPCGRAPDALRVVAIDAATIARECGLGAIVATPMLGAFAAATGLVTLDDLLAAVEEWTPVKSHENAAACLEAFRQASPHGTLAT